MSMVLVLASYCGPEDGNGCTDTNPCPDCMDMCNVFDVDLSRAEFIAQFDNLKRGVRKPPYSSLSMFKPCDEVANEIQRLRDALTLFLAADETMEGILWGEEPDTALVKISLPMGKYREARAALKSSTTTPTSPST